MSTSSTSASDANSVVANLLSANGYNSGMYRDEEAFLENYDAISGNSVAIMKLSETVEATEMAASEGAIDTMNQTNSDLQAYINEHSGDSDFGPKVAGFQSQLTLENTQYNETNQFYTGLDNGLNQTSADATQTQGTDMQMFDEGPIALARTLAQII